MVNILLTVVPILLYVGVVVSSSLVPVAELHPPKPYKFGYAIKDKHGEQYRQEAGDGLQDVKGSYGFVDERGIKRQVNYVADKEGFRAEVKTNEPGTSPQNPASVKMVSSAKALEETESIKKEFPVSPSALEKYFKEVAKIYNSEKSLAKKFLFGIGTELAKDDSEIEKEVDNVDTASEAKLALEKFFEERFRLASFLENAGLPLINREVEQKEKLDLSKQFGLDYWNSNQFTLPLVGGALEKDPLLNEVTMFQKLGSVAYAPWLFENGLGSVIPSKKAVNIKELGTEHLLKGIALAPGTSKNGLAFIPIY